VEPYSGRVVVTGPLSQQYAAYSYFQVQANNTKADYGIPKTDIGMWAMFLYRWRFNNSSNKAYIL